MLRLKLHLFLAVLCTWASISWASDDENRRRCKFFVLPFNVQVMVYKDMGSEDRRNFSSTCRAAWQLYVKQGYVNINVREVAEVETAFQARPSTPIRHLKLYNIADFSRLDLLQYGEKYLQTNYLKSLSIHAAPNEAYGSKLPNVPNIIEFVCQFPHLTYLHLDFYDEKGACCLSKLKFLKELKILRLVGVQGNQLDEFFKNMEELPSLQELDLRRTIMTDGMPGIRKFQNLLKLNLSSVLTKLDELLARKVLLPLAKLPQLQELDLSWNILGDSVNLVGNITTLRVLDISKARVNGSIDLSFLTRLCELRVLRCRDNKIAYSSNGGSFNLDVASRLTVLSELSLKELDLGDENYIRSEYVQFLTGLTSLTSLRLSVNETDHELGNSIGKSTGQLTVLTNLISLGLFNAGLSAADASALNTMTNLTRLDLRGNYFTEEPQLNNLKNTVIEMDPIEKKPTRRR